MRKPISRPSSPSKDPPGGLRPSRLSKRPRLSEDLRPSPSRPSSSLRATTASTSLGDSWNAPRTISMKARKGVCCPSGVQLPIRTHTRSFTICPMNSCKRRDLPMPGSPTMSKTWMPGPIALKPSSSFSSSRSRPT